MHLSTKKKTGLFILLAGLVLAASLFTALAVNVLASDPIEISSAEDFAAIATDDTALAESYILTADITIPQGIGSADHPFTGSFDGNGKTITISYELTDTSITGVGVFNHTSGAAVSNLTVAGSVSVKSVETSNLYIFRIGGIIGSAYDTSIDSCTNNAAVTALSGGIGNYTAKGVGGIAGYAENSTVTGCTNTGAVKSGTSGSADNSYFVAGVAGWAVNTSFTDCANEGRVEGRVAVGGIAGYATLKSFTGCTNSGLIGAANISYNFGGIAGYGVNTSFSGCINRGSLVGYTYGGGIAGVIGGETATATPTVMTAPASVIGCFNTGSITLTNTAVGGIVGRIYGSASARGTISGCASSGNISSSIDGSPYPNMGGIAGWINYVSVTDCLSNGNLTGAGDTRTGGIIGYANGTAADVNYMSGCFFGGYLSTGKTGVTVNFTALVGTREGLMYPSQSYYIKGRTTYNGGVINTDLGSPAMGIGLTEEEAANPASFTGFDFTSASPVWKMSSGGSITAAYLASMPCVKYDHSFTIYVLEGRAHYDCPYCGLIYPDFKTDANGAPVVFCTSEAGDDANTGFDAGSPLKTTAAGLNFLKRWNIGGTIVFCDASAWGGEVTFADVGGPVTVTSLFDGVDYRTENDACLQLAGTVTLSNDYNFNNIVFLSTSGLKYIYTNGNDLHVEDTVFMDSSSNPATYVYAGHESRADNTPTYNIVTGRKGAADGDAGSYSDGSSAIIIEGGCWKGLYLGNCAGGETYPAPLYTPQTLSDFSTTVTLSGDAVLFGVRLGTVTDWELQLNIPAAIWITIDKDVAGPGDTLSVNYTDLGLGYNGFSIRTSGTYDGIRAKFSVFTASLETGFAAYTVKEVGTLISTAENKNNLLYFASGSTGSGGEGEYSGSIGKSVAYNTVSSVSRFFEESGSSLIYTAILTGDFSSHYISGFSFRPYVVLTDGAADYVIYGSTYTRSIGYVANQMVGETGGEYYIEGRTAQNESPSVPDIVWNAYQAFIQP